MASSWKGVRDMSRSISGCWFGSLVILVVASVQALSADKNAKPNPGVAVAREQVEAALRAEAEGNNDRRAELLASAASAAPNLPEANWHLARVQIADKWLSLSEAEQQAADDPKLAEYRKLRDEAGGNPKLIRNLARWCVKAEWDDLAGLHYSQLLSRSDIDGDIQAEAIKRLDLHNVRGVWMTGSELKEHQERAQSVDAALRKWRPRLMRLQPVIDGDDSFARDKAVKELTAMDDPQVIVVLESLFADAGIRFSEEAVHALARFPHIEATQSLVRVAVMSSYVGARTAAIAALKSRPKQDYMPLLLTGLFASAKTQFSISVARNGAVEYAQAIGMEGAGARYIRVQCQTAMPATLNPRTGVLSRGGTGQPQQIMTEVAKAQLQAQLVSTEVEFANRQIAAANRLRFEALEQLSDAQLPRDATQYWDWWQDYNQCYWPKPTYCAYQQQPPSYYVTGTRNECFVAGTLVRTRLGTLPIESLQAGDYVLAQDQDTGEVAYKVVLRTTIRPPAKMVRIESGGEQITTTLGHPFWVEGQGWKMAKELKAGDLLHTLGGAVRIDKIEPAREDKAYNLVVDDFNSYFVGQQGLLAHDNEFRKPTRAIVPGLSDDHAAVAAAVKK